MITERLRDGHRWLRVADPTWGDPLDPGFAAERGGRWNPAATFPVLYLNEDLVTARVNASRFFDGKPYRPEELRDDAAPMLVEATLPRSQTVADLHTATGVRDVGLPASYPLDRRGRLVSHRVCQKVGQAIHDAGLRGVLCRSARTPFGAGRELAWFPAGRRSHAHAQAVHLFSAWFWA